MCPYWYTGVHKPLITKELYDAVQAQVKSRILKVENKEFAFTRLMECGLCGSGVCADEKFKPLKNGGLKRHVYYGCTKARDKNCKCGYLNENDLIDQFVSLMDIISLDEIGINEKIKLEVERFKKFQRYVLGTTEPVSIVDIDIRNYAKYLLKDGSDLEKRDLLSCLKSKIYLREKIISLGASSNEA